jgi:hypothetical protein
MNVPADGNA